VPSYELIARQGNILRFPDRVTDYCLREFFGRMRELQRLGYEDAVLDFMEVTRA
jgi:hypothetical protein